MSRKIEIEVFSVEERMPRDPTGDESGTNVIIRCAGEWVDAWWTSHGFKDADDYRIYGVTAWAYWPELEEEA